MYTAQFFVVTVLALCVATTYGACYVKSVCKSDGTTTHFAYTDNQCTQPASRPETVVTGFNFPGMMNAEPLDTCTAGSGYMQKFTCNAATGATAQVIYSAGSKASPCSGSVIAQDDQSGCYLWNYANEKACKTDIQRSSGLCRQRGVYGAGISQCASSSDAQCQVYQKSYSTCSAFCQAKGLYCNAAYKSGESCETDECMSCSASHGGTGNMCQCGTSPGELNCKAQVPTPAPVTSTALLQSRYKKTYCDRFGNTREVLFDDRKCANQVAQASHPQNRKAWGAFVYNTCIVNSYVGSNMKLACDPSSGTLTTLFYAKGDASCSGVPIGQWKGDDCEDSQASSQAQTAAKSSTEKSNKPSEGVADIMMSSSSYSGASLMFVAFAATWSSVISFCN